MRYRVKHVVEYGILRVVCAVLNLLPYRLALLLVWVLARLVFACSPARVREATRRLAVVFGPRFTPRQRRQVAWQSLRNIAFNTIELMRMGRPAGHRLADRYVDHAAIIDTLAAQARTGAGGIVAVPHMGNWEMAAGTCSRFGVPIFTVAANQRNPLTNAFLTALRNRPGIATVQRGEGTMRQVIRRLRAGGFLAILPDVRAPKPDISVPFLGGEANISSGMALFARLGNVPLFPGYATRTGWTRQTYHVAPPIWPDPSLPKEEDTSRMTRYVMAVLDRAIQEQPEQWFWFNRRWILDPVPKPDAPAP